MADSAAPAVLSSMLLRQCSPRRRPQCTTIPACEKVKATNTPTAYRGISAPVRPANTANRIAAATARAMMPLLNAKRSPSRRNRRGACPFRAMKESNRGNPLKAVLAASSRTSAVATCTYV
jgi:hypothetical protein